MNTAKRVAEERETHLGKEVRKGEGEGLLGRILIWDSNTYLKVPVDSDPFNDVNPLHTYVLFVHMWGIPPPPPSPVGGVLCAV